MDDSKGEKKWSYYGSIFDGEVKQWEEHRNTRLDYDSGDDDPVVYRHRREYDENGDKAPQDPTYLTVLKIDDQTLVPPAGPNTYPKPTKKADFLPRRARIVQCPRRSMGLDCNNAQCIGKTVQGYKWMW